MEGINLQTFSRRLNENLEPPVQKHLKNVYATFTMSALSAVVGGYVHLFSSFFGGGLLTGLGAIVLLIWLCITPFDGKNQKKRLALLGGFSFLTGVNLGPLLQIAVMVDHTLILQALLGTSIVFACFSLAALFAPRGYYLYLGGFLLSCLSTLFWLSLFNFFFGSTLIYQAHIYLGLLMMCGFVVYDTQVIVEKARGGNKDYIMDSVLLFIDFVAIFKRILIILTDKEAQNKRKKRG